MNNEVWSLLSENPVPSESYQRLDHLTLGGRIPVLLGERDWVSSIVPPSLEMSPQPWCSHGRPMRERAVGVLAQSWLHDDLAAV